MNPYDIKNFGYIELDEYRKLRSAFSKRFGSGIPLYQIPESETFGELKASIERCFAEDRNMLDEIYDIVNDGTRLY